MVRYMEGCDICQRIENRTKMLVEKPKLSEVSEKLWTYLIIDFVTKLLLVAGRDAILVVCNRLFKIAHFVATTEGTLAEGLAWDCPEIRYGSCMDCWRVLCQIENCSLQQR